MRTHNDFSDCSPKKVADTFTDRLELPVDSVFGLWAESALNCSTNKQARQVIESINDA